VNRDPLGLGGMLYGFRPQPHGVGTLLAAGAHFMTLIPDGHGDCGISTFCKNPLHPGPCKGWKKSLGQNAPGALNAIEKAHKEKVAAKRVARNEAKSAASKALTGRQLASPLHAKKATIKAANTLLGDDEAKAAKKADRVILNKQEIKKYSKIKAAQMNAMRAKYGLTEDPGLEDRIADALATDNILGKDATYRNEIGNSGFHMGAQLAEKHCAKGDGDCDGKPYEWLRDETARYAEQALLTGDDSDLNTFLKDYDAGKAKPPAPKPEPKAAAPVSEPEPEAPAGPALKKGEQSAADMFAGLDAAAPGDVLGTWQYKKGAQLKSSFEYRKGADGKLEVWEKPAGFPDFKKIAAWESQEEMKAAQANSKPGQMGQPGVVVPVMIIPDVVKKPPAKKTAKAPAAKTGTALQAEKGKDFGMGLMAMAKGNKTLGTKAAQKDFADKIQAELDGGGKPVVAAGAEVIASALITQATNGNMAQPSIPLAPNEKKKFQELLQAEIEDGLKGGDAPKPVTETFTKAIKAKYAKDFDAAKAAKAEMNDHIKVSAAEKLGLDPNASANVIAAHILFKPDINLLDGKAKARLQVLDGMTKEEFEGLPGDVQATAAQWLEDRANVYDDGDGMITSSIAEVIALQQKFGLPEYKLANDGPPVAAPSSEPDALQELMDGIPDAPGAASVLGGPVDVSTWKKVGGQGGSNLGGMYEAPDGTKYYVKSLKSPEHAQNEVLAAGLYKAAGIDVPDVQHGTGHPDGWKNVVVSKVVPGKADKGKLIKDGDFKAATQDGYAVDAWLANYDTVGLTHDNIVDSNGKPVRIDVGGSLEYRAQGSKKTDWNANPDIALKGLKDSGKNPQAASVFGSMTPAQEKKSAEHLLNVSDEQIDQLVADAGMPASMAATLKARKQAILAKYGLAGGASPAPSAPAAPAPVATPAPAPSVPTPAALPNAAFQAPADAKKAIDFATGAKSGTLTKKFEAYQVLEGDDFAQLTPEVQGLILADLQAAKVKFIAPNKKAKVQETLDYLTPFGGGGAGAGGAVGATNPAAKTEADKIHDGADWASKFVPLLDKPGDKKSGTKDEIYAASLAMLTQASTQGTKDSAAGMMADIWAGEALKKLNSMHQDPFGNDFLLPEDIDSMKPALAADLKKKFTGEPGPTPVLDAWTKAINLGVVEDAEAFMNAATPGAGAGASDFNAPTPPKLTAEQKIAQEVEEAGAALAAKQGWPADSPALIAFKEALTKSKLAELAAANSTAPSAPSAPPAPAPTSTAVGTGTDLAGIPEAKQQEIFDDLKGFPSGKYLSHPKQETYGNLLALAAAHGTPGQPLSVLQVLKSVDAMGAKKANVANANKWENEFVAWLQTPDGAAFAAANPTADPKLVQKITGDYGPYQGIQTDLNELAKKVNLLPGPGAFDASKPSSDFNFTSAAAAGKWRKQMLADQGGTYTPDQLAGIKVYTGHSFSSMNSWLRGKTSTIDASRKKAIKQTQDAMRPLPVDTLLIRGTGWDALPEGFQSAKGAQQLIGKTVMDEAFMSTSVGDTPGYGSGQPLWLEIEAPKGTMAAFVEGPGISSNPGEREMLLAAGQQYQILGVEKKGSRTHVRVRIVTP
jgi:hypothetical protein